MKYFYDTEFIEDGKTIDLISIAVVCEDGREFYAISKEFKARKASRWVKDNVLKYLPQRKISFYDSPRVKEGYKLWRSRKQIKEDLLNFIGNDTPEFWAYYADYDHVALCQLFGTMMELPKGWPMYTRDLKQLLDDNGNPKQPKPEDEHLALADARWVKDVYKRLTVDKLQNPQT